MGKGYEELIRVRKKWGNLKKKGPFRGAPYNSKLAF